MLPLDRRTFFRRAAGAAGATLVPTSLAGLVAACSDLDPDRGLSPTEPSLGRGGHDWPGDRGYGPLDNDQGVLLLPRDFRLRTFGAIGDPMSDGNVTPIAHDGMAAFRHRWQVRLLRNHEDRNGPTGQTIAAGRAYDPAAGGGVVTLELNGRRELVRDFVSLNGTAVNCAGGPTPWDSWLSCEETVVGRSEGFEKTHGWCFDVSSRANSPVNPVPIKAMGRFSHEAVAVDPRTGIVYETEDNGFPPGSGFYRFLPRWPGHLRAGGTLQMAAVRGEPNLELFRGGFAPGTEFDIDWVDIEHVDPDPEDTMSIDDRLAGVFMQGYEQGAAVFSRLEGCWFGRRSVFFHDTSGGAAGRGQVWRYIPDRFGGWPRGFGDHSNGSRGNSHWSDRRWHRGGGKLVLVFESPGEDVLDGPDNITVSPRGGLALCEDGGGTQFLRGLTRRGEIFDFAVNQLNDTEFAGATFSPDGQTLFVNIQGSTRGAPSESAGQGLTCAIWGPWRRGAL